MNGLNIPTQYLAYVCENSVTLDSNDNIEENVKFLRDLADELETTPENYKGVVLGLVKVDKDDDGDECVDITTMVLGSVAPIVAAISALVDKGNKVLNPRHGLSEMLEQLRD